MIASLADIEAVIVECQHCRAQVKIPVDAQLVLRDQRMVPLTQCSICHQAFDSTLIDYVRAFIGSLTVHRGKEKLALLLRSEGD